MVFYQKLFGNNVMFTDVTQISLLHPYMYLKPSNNTVQTPVPNTPNDNPTVILRGESDDFSNNKTDPFVTRQPNVAEFSVPASKVDDLRILPNILQDKITPKKPDKLFWCVYIAFYGYSEYEQIGHRYGNIEIEEKQKMVEIMKKSPNLSKNSPKKITKALFQEIMSDFMTNKKITIDMLSMIAVYYNKKFLISYLNEKGEPEPFYMEILGNRDTEDSETILLYKRGKYDYSISFVDESEFSPSSIFKFENHDLPLKAVSNYKTDELEYIFNVLNITREPGKKYKKGDYYAKIMERCGDIGT